jgi:hypothetical protein
MFCSPGPLRRTVVLCLLALTVLCGLVAATPHLHAQSAAQAGSAAAGTTRDLHTYDVSLRGIRAGTLTLDAEQAGTAYRVTARIESTGLGAAIRRVRFIGETTGTIRNGRYRPTRYAEDADTGKRHSVSVIEYRRGVPTVVSYRADRDHRLTTVDPATQGGTLDPMTSLYAVLRDVPQASACTARFVSFDGRRRTETALLSATRDGDRVICTGLYTRVAGYAPEELAERSRFPFTLTYAPAPDGRLRVVEVSLDTTYGRALMRRR